MVSWFRARKRSHLVVWDKLDFFAAVGNQLSKISCPVGKGLDESSSHEISNIIKKGTKCGLRQAKCKSCLPKGQARMQVVFFFKPCGWTVKPEECLISSRAVT